MVLFSYVLLCFLLVAWLTHVYVMYFSHTMQLIDTMIITTSVAENIQFEGVVMSEMLVRLKMRKTIEKFFLCVASCHHCWFVFYCIFLFLFNVIIATTSIADVSLLSYQFKPHDKYKCKYNWFSLHSNGKQKQYTIL